MHTLVDAKPLLDLLKNSSTLIDTLLSLVELVDLVVLGGGGGGVNSSSVTNSTNSNGQQSGTANATRLTKMDQDKALVDADLTSLFVGLTAYFHLRTSPLFAAKHKLALYVDSVVFRLARHAQKCLLKSAVNLSHTNSHDENENLDRLMRAYFRMLFAFVVQPNTDFHTYQQKIATIEMAAQFWRALNGRLKRSLDLSQFLLARLCRSWTANFYFRAVSTTTTSRGVGNSVSSQQQQQAPVALTQEQFVRFAHVVFGFASEIIQMSVVPDMECLVYLHVMFHLTRCDKLRKQSKKYTNFNLSNGEYALEDEVFALECANLRFAK